jgi:DNA-binding HxlR family transcriptional regulator
MIGSVRGIRRGITIAPMALLVSSRICPRFQSAADLLGKRWTGLVVQSLLDGPARFGELSERLEVVGDRMLAVRLRELEQQAVVERRVLPDRHVEYRLTRKGRALGRVSGALARWAEEWVELPAARAG